LAELTWTDSEKLFKQTDVALLPVGSTEQHGPHNPLGTDHLVAEKLSAIVGKRTGVPVLPVVPVGVSEHHRHFSGTLWVPSLVLGEYVKAIVLSAASHGARKIVIVNGHGGNQSTLLEVAGELRRRHNVFAVHLMAFPLAQAGPPGHADALETSVNLYFHKNLVKMEQAVDTKVKEYLGSLKIKGYDHLGLAQFAWDTIDLTDTGTFGAAGQTIRLSDSSEAVGKKLVEPFIDNVCEFVEALKNAKVDELLSRPH
jgi:creatinine amidohydrolase